MSSTSGPVSPSTLNASEQQLVADSQAGLELNLSGSSQSISASVIFELCTGRRGVIHPRGVRLRNATISGVLDFSGSDITMPLYLTQCDFSNPIVLRDVRARTVSFEGSTIPGFEGERCEVAGALAFKDCRIAEAVRLSDASIGVLNFGGAQIQTKQNFAVRADRASVRGSVFFRDAFKSSAGISLEDTRIGGRLDFAKAEISGNAAAALAATGLDLKGMLDFSESKITGEVVLTAAQIGGIAHFARCILNNGKDRALGADGAQFKSAVIFDAAACTGLIEIAYATVAATFECKQSSTFSVPGDVCLRLTELKTGGSIALRSEFEGSVDLGGAQAGGNIEIGPAVFRNPGGTAIWLEGAVIRSSLKFEDTQIAGDLSLGAARISNSLDWGEKTRIKGNIYAGEISVQAHVATAGDFSLSGTCFMNGARIGGLLTVGGVIEGGLSIGSSEITGAVKFDHCALTGNLQAPGAVCKSGVEFGAAFSCHGTVNLSGAQISNQFSAKQATFNNPGGVALDLDNGVIKGNADCEKMKANGTVRLRNTEVNGDLKFSGASINGTGGRAIRAAGCVVKSGLFLDEGFNAIGGVRLSRARITGVLNFYKAAIKQTDPKEPALRCQSMEVQGRFEFRRCHIDGDVVLTGSRVGLMVDDFESWPIDRYRIDNFSYQGLRFGEETMPSDRRREWLLKQMSFSLESYEQAAKILRGAGYDREARQIARARRDDLRSRGNLGAVGKLSNWALSVSIGHGYQLWRVLIPAILLAIIGTAVFTSAYSTSGALVPKDSSNKVPFVGAMYSIDALVPIVNFRQKDNFVFKSDTPHLIWYERYFWFHTFMGWLLSTLLVAGLSGVTKRE